MQTSIRLIRLISLRGQRRSPNLKKGAKGLPTPQLRVSNAAQITSVLVVFVRRNSRHFCFRLLRVKHHFVRHRKTRRVKIHQCDFETKSVVDAVILKELFMPLGERMQLGGPDGSFVLCSGGSPRGNSSP